MGAYHFFHYRKDGRRQARHFLATLRKTTGLSQLLPLVVDVETLPSLGTPNRTRARSRLHALLDELYRQTGSYPMIYTSSHMWKQVAGEPLGFGRYPLWVACWKCDRVHMPRGWSSWRFWQFGQFRFGGGLPRLDGNVYAASQSGLPRERQRECASRQAPNAHTQQVVADLRGYHGKDVRVALDDRTYGNWRPFEQTLNIDLGEAQGAREVRVQLRSFRNVRSPVVAEGIQLDSVAPSVSGPRLTGGGGRCRATAGGSASQPRCRQRMRPRASNAPRWRPAVTEPSARAASVPLPARPRSRHRSHRLHAQGERHRPRRPFDLTQARAPGGARGRPPTQRRDHIPRGMADDAAGRRAGAHADPHLERRATASMRFEGAQFAVVARRGPAAASSTSAWMVSSSGASISTSGHRRSTRRFRRQRAARQAHAGAARDRHSRQPREGSAVALDAALVLDRRR